MPCISLPTHTARPIATASQQRATGSGTRAIRLIVCRVGRRDTCQRNLGSLALLELARGSRSSTQDNRRRLDQEALCKEKQLVKKNVSASALIRKHERRQLHCSQSKISANPRVRFAEPASAPRPGLCCTSPSFSPAAPVRNPGSQPCFCWSVPLCGFVWSEIAGDS